MSTSPAPASARYQDPDEDQHAIEEEDDRPELGHLAQWTVSSHKYGFGVENLRDNNELTFWQ
jgi:anaphase-promoting complex subunit 10